MRVTFFGDWINSFVNDVVAFVKSYAPPVTEESPRVAEKLSSVTSFHA